MLESARRHKREKKGIVAESQQYRTIALRDGCIRGLNFGSMTMAQGPDHLDLSTLPEASRAEGWRARLSVLGLAHVVEGNLGVHATVRKSLFDRKRAPCTSMESDYRGRR